MLARTAELGRLAALGLCTVCAAACKAPTGTSSSAPALTNIDNAERELVLNAERLSAAGIVEPRRDLASVPPGAGNAAPDGDDTADFEQADGGGEEAQAPPSEPEPAAVGPIEADTTSKSAEAAPRRAARCNRVCDLAEASCDLAQQICDLAARHTGEVRYANACNRAGGQCEAASAACDACESGC